MSSDKCQVTNVRWEVSNKCHMCKV